MLTNEYILLSTEYFTALIIYEATIPEDVSLSSIIQEYLHRS